MTNIRAIDVIRDNKYEKPYYEQQLKLCEENLKAYRDDKTLVAFNEYMLRHYKFKLLNL